MDSAADSLLALSNTAVALAEEDEVEEDDDRSSSLSELDEDGPDNVDSEGAAETSGVEGDSEAETERLEVSPHKLARKKSFGATPSKLAQATHIDERPEIESLTDSDISSLISSIDESDSLSDAPGEEEEVPQAQFQHRSPGKRKREDDEEEDVDPNRARKRRTRSILSEDAKSDRGSDIEDLQSQPSREATAEPDIEGGITEDVNVEDEEEEAEEEDQKVDSNEELNEKPRARVRSTRRTGKEEIAQEEDQDAEEEADAVEESDDAEVDDAEIQAKNEEELAKRMAAMEGLTALERHFAALRDRLYDERIATINYELAQLAETVPTHPELLRQLDVVLKHRDEKFDVEQKLLVYKIGTLKNKSVAERSQIHSAYYQTVRDIREKHLERLSEHFYRIQRDRFKSETVAPSYAIPFPTRRSKRITQQTAYNREVSILSGIAKYVGFPAAPELSHSHQKELEEDLQKMGLSTQIRASRPQRMTSAFSSALTAPAAEEQFLEKNPWANPQHPMHRLGTSNRGLNQSPPNDTYLTPANQQRPTETLAVGSASTIVEHPSAPASSNFNTPHETGGLNNQTSTGARNGILGHRVHSASPLETRRQIHPGSEVAELELNREPKSSPLAARMSGRHSPSRSGGFGMDGISAHGAASNPHAINAPGITAGAGLGGGRFLA